ncbi:MAG: hypothetical protein ACW981_21100 [Candidatus Hodarchaeales archaeon]|jgi:hypothetical protein
MFQIEPITPLTDLSPLIELLILGIIVVIAFLNYSKYKIWEIQILIFGINLIITLISMKQNVLVYTPYIQLFFIFLHLILLYSAYLKVKK